MHLQVIGRTVMDASDLVLNGIVHGVKYCLGGGVAATHLRFKVLKRNSPK